MIGDRCRYCGTMDDRIHGLECPVMPMFHVLELAEWCLHVELLLAEALGSVRSHGHDVDMHVAREKERIKRWRLEHHLRKIG
jgi:hypothetical protein